MKACVHHKISMHKDSQALSVEFDFGSCDSNQGGQ
jgi:hypothetical protein